MVFDATSLSFVRTTDRLEQRLRAHVDWRALGSRAAGAHYARRRGGGAW
jgi:hypothetical protein